MRRILRRFVQQHHPRVLLHQISQRASQPRVSSLRVDAVRLQRPQARPHASSVASPDGVAQCPAVVDSGRIAELQPQRKFQPQRKSERCAQLTSEPFSFVDAKFNPIDGPVFRCNSSTWTGPY